MATTIYTLTNQATIASGATVEFTLNWSWGKQTFNDWMVCAAYSEEAGIDGIFIDYRLNVISTIASRSPLAEDAVGKVIRNEYGSSDFTTTFQAAGVQISG